MLRTITIPIGENTELVEPYEVHVVYIEAGFASKRYFGSPKDGAVVNRYGCLGLRRSPDITGTVATNIGSKSVSFF